MRSRCEATPLTVRHPHCAGIDIGKKPLHVAVSEDAADANVRTFASFTDDLFDMDDWPVSYGVEQVTMEATGVLWIPTFEILDRTGLEVRLVDPLATRRPDGRKTVSVKKFCLTFDKKKCPTFETFLLLNSAQDGRSRLSVDTSADESGADPRGALRSGRVLCPSFLRPSRRPRTTSRDSPTPSSATERNTWNARLPISRTNTSHAK